MSSKTEVVVDTGTEGRDLDGSDLRPRFTLYHCVWRSLTLEPAGRRYRRPVDGNEKNLLTYLKGERSRYERRTNLSSLSSFHITLIQLAFSHHSQKTCRDRNYIVICYPTLENDPSLLPPFKEKSVENPRKETISELMSGRGSLHHLRGNTLHPSSTPCDHD